MSEAEFFLDNALDFPLSESEFRIILNNLEEIDHDGNGTIVMGLKNHPGGVRLIQASKNGDMFRVDTAKESSGGKPEMFALRAVSLKDAAEALKDVCVRGAEPTLGSWENVTKEVLPVRRSRT